MALPEIREVGTAEASPSALTFLTGKLPAVEPGDLLVGFFESAGTTTGAEAEVELKLVGWTVFVSHARGNTRLTIAWKLATGTSDRRVTNDTGDHQLGRLISIKKGTFNEEEPIHKSAASGQAATKSVKCPSITTTLADCLVLFAATGTLPKATGTTEFSAEANAALASVTERIDNTTAEGDGGALLVASGTKATKGEVGESTATAVTEAERATATIAIAPYSDPGSPKPIAASKTEATGTSAEVARVSGEAGDMILVAIYAALNKTISVAGGTAIGTPKFITGGPMCATFWVPWSAGEKIKVTWTGSESQTYVVDQVSYRNCDPTNPVDVASNWEEKASSQSPVAPAVETLGPNRRVVALTSNVNGNEPDEWPAGMTGRISYTPAICDVHQAAKGSTGTKTFHLTVARVTGVQTLALKKTEGEAKSKTLEDTVAVSDSLVKAASKVLADAQAIADAVAKKAAKALADAPTIADALTTARTLGKLLADTIGVADAIAKKAMKVLADSQAVSDAQSKRPIKGLADTAVVTDLLTKATHKLLADAAKVKDRITFPQLVGTFIRYLGKWVKVK